MTNKKNTRRALFMSAMSLILCFAMLMGTTFAWFTDSVTSSNNIIKSGNLDVEMYYAKGTEAVPTDSTGWTDASKGPMFTYELWEPGYTDVRHIKIENKGSLDLKYQLMIQANGVVSKLADVIDVHFFDPATPITSRTDLTDNTKVGVLSNVLASMPKSTSGTLLAGKSATITLALKMQEGAGNEYQNLAIGADFSVILVATQLTSENDSFGPDYDKDAWDSAMKVTNDQELQAAINAGETHIALENDIDLNEALVIPAAPTTYGLRSSGIRIDLNGKTLNNPNGYVIENKGNIVITGNGTISGLGGIRSTAGSVIIENGNFYASSRWQDTVYQHTLKAENSNVVINGGNFDATVNGHTNAMLNASENATITINGGNFKNVAGDLTQFDPYIATYEKNGKIVINDGTFYGGWRFNGETTTTDINGGNFTVGFDGQSFHANSTHVVTVYGGTFTAGAKLTGKLDEIVAAGYEAVDNGNGTLTVKFPQKSFDSLIENAGAGDTVEIPAGTYTFPASDLKAGVTLECAEGTVFDGKTDMNINGATVVGATFTNDNDYLVNSTTINGTFKDCVFTDCDGLRYCYAGETVVFENCVFDTDFYGVHFDGGENEVVFRNCTFSGFNTFGGALKKLTMDNCTFKYNGKGGYNGINMWGDTDMINCTFVFDGSASYEWVDLSSSDQTVTFTSCVVTNGTNETPIENVIGNYGTGNTVIVDGVRLVHSNDDLKAAVAAGVNEIMLANGEYDLNGIQKDGLTLVGVGNDVKMANTTNFAGGGSIGAITKAVNLENMTITNTVYTMENGSNASFTEVNFAAGFRHGYGKNVSFTDCSFGSNSEGYALHFETDSASEGGIITLNGCEFEGGKVHLGGKRTYTFTGCDFAVGTDFQVWSNITLDGCSVNGEKVTAESVETLFPNLSIDKVTIK